MVSVYDVKELSQFRFLNSHSKLQEHEVELMQLYGARAVGIELAEDHFHLLFPEDLGPALEVHGLGFLLGSPGLQPLYQLSPVGKLLLVQVRGRLAYERRLLVRMHT